MTRPCQCTGPGWCERHQCNKNATLVQLCLTNDRYWRAWEEGRGPGQRKSDGKRWAICRKCEHFAQLAEVCSHPDAICSSQFSAAIRKGDPADCPEGKWPQPAKPCKPAGPGGQLRRMLGCPARRWPHYREMDQLGEACIDHVARFAQSLVADGYAARIEAAERLIERAISMGTSDGKLQPKDKADWISCADLANASVKLASLLPPDVSRVVGVPRSGMAPAGIIATILHRPLYSLNNGKLVPVGGGSRARWGQLEDSPGRTVYIDDTIHNGGTLRLLKESHPELADGITAVCFARLKDVTRSLIDFWAEELPTPHILEWNLFNAAWASVWAFDLDGVVACNPPWESRPLYLPRSVPVKAIITSRPENERDATTTWLNEFGVRYKKLIMWTGSESNRWNEKAVGRWKAEQVKSVNAQAYVESEPGIADVMRGHGVKVLCPVQGRFE